MTQGTRNTTTTKPKVKKKRTYKRGLHSRPHKQKYGTSKLEYKFATEFLDKLHIKYEWQYEAKSIGRFYDFCVPGARLLIEVDGDYYHSRGLQFESMSPMQKHNHMVDEIKNKWANLNGFKLLRIWEYDINNDPAGVLDVLRKAIGIAGDKERIKASKQIRH